MDKNKWFSGYYVYRDSHSLNYQPIAKKEDNDNENENTETDKQYPEYIQKK